MAVRLAALWAAAALAALPGAASNSAAATPAASAGLPPPTYSAAAELQPPAFPQATQSAYQPPSAWGTLPAENFIF